MPTYYGLWYDNPNHWLHGWWADTIGRLIYFSDLRLAEAQLMAARNGIDEPERLTVRIIGEGGRPFEVTREKE